MNPSNAWKGKLEAATFFAIEKSVQAMCLHDFFLKQLNLRILKIVPFVVERHIFELISLFHSIERFQQTFDPFWAPQLFFSVTAYLWVFSQNQWTLFDIHCSNATQTFSLNLGDFINARHSSNNFKLTVFFKALEIRWRNPGRIVVM